MLSSPIEEEFRSKVGSVIEAIKGGKFQYITLVFCCQDYEGYSERCG